MAQNPYAFIVGCARSGTTLLRRMLDHHPQLVMAEDTHFIPKCLKDRSALVDPPLTPDLVDCARGYRRFQRMGLPDSAVDRARAGARTYGEFVSGLYTEMAAASGKPLSGHKAPDYVRYLPLLHHLFPWVRFLHILRDGRDVALSLLQWARPDRGPGRFMLWDEQPVGVSALWWQWMVGHGRKGSAAMPTDRYLEIRYEALVGQPRETLDGVLSFLELPFSDEALHYYRGRSRPEPGRDAKSAWLPPTPGLRDWRRDMAERDVELFEAIAGDLLDELGYERAFRQISPSIAEVAERCGDWWKSDRGKRSASKKR